MGHLSGNCLTCGWDCPACVQLWRVERSKKRHSRAVDAGRVCVWHAISLVPVSLAAALVGCVFVLVCVYVRTRVCVFVWLRLMCCVRVVGGVATQ